MLRCRLAFGVQHSHAVVADHHYVVLYDLILRWAQVTGITLYRVIRGRS
jgi:hypothetical protein